MNRFNYIFLAIMLILSVSSVQGATLLNYYNFDDPNLINTIFIDSTGRQNISSNDSQSAGIYKSTTSGKIGNATYANASVGNIRCENLTFPSNSGFAINYWYYHNGTTNNQQPINFYPSSVFSSYQNNFTTLYTAGTLRVRINATTIFQNGVDGLGNSSAFTWNMHTFVQDEFGIITEYYNGQQVNSTGVNTYGDIIINPVMFCIGGNSYDGYDEMSIYNTTLTTFEIINLYNTGSGLNYSTTNSDINVPVPPVNVCIDENTYCSDGIYNSATGTYTCYFENTQNCNAGCTGDVGEAVCDNTCTNECNILASRTCLSTTSYGICQDANNDGCYEFVTSVCSSGEYCQASGNFFASCTAVASSGLSNNSVFSVTPYSINTNDTNYVLDSSTRTIAASTKNSAHIQRFYTTAPNSSYTSRTCDYEESVIYTNVVQVSLGNGTAYTMTNTASPSRVDLVIVPQNLIYSNVSIKDSLGTSMVDVRIFRNETRKSLTIYFANGSIIYDDISTNSFDDLTGLNLSFNFDFVSGTRTMTATFDRATNNKVSTAPQLFAGTSVSDLWINTTNTTFVSLVQSTYTQPNGFTVNIPQAPEYLPCMYTNTGSYLVRTYNNADGYPDFSNYFDYVVNVQALGLSETEFDAQTLQGDDNVFGNTLLALLITIGVALLFGAIVFGATKSSDKVGGLTALAVFVGVIIGLIFSVALGYLPIVYALLIGIVDAIIIVVVVKLTLMTG